MFRLIGWTPLAVIVALPSVGAAQHEWRLYEFRANERYRYEFQRTEDDETTTGFYALAIEPAGEGRLKMNVQGQLGDMECSSSVTTESSRAFPPQLMMSCAPMAPVMVAFALPMWGWFMGRSWNAGDEWSMRQGDESFSFRVEGECRHAGQRGMLAVMKQNDELRLQSCVARDVALPLAVTFREESGDAIEMRLVEYRP